MAKALRGGIILKRAKVIFDKEKLKTFLKPTKKKVIILAVAVIFVAAFGGIFGKKNKMVSNTFRENDMVIRGNLDVTITGSAAVEPLQRFEIIPKVSGDITYCPYEVGDSVQKDDILYMFDSSDTDITVERQRVSMQQSENNYRDALKEREKLSLKAKNDGIISGLTIKEGQEVNNGTKIASVDNTAILEVDLPFTQAQIGLINVGDEAVVTSSKHMSTVSGTVTHKASAAFAGNDGSTLYNVTVEFTNPGAFYAGMEVGGSVGGNISPGSGTVSNSSSGTIVTETDGTVSKVNFSNGDYVTKGTVIATLTSDTVTDKINDSTLSYKSASLSMQQTEKDLENYNITAPINGTVITKNSKAGDTIDKTNSSTTLMVIADISKLKFELAIDELDVSKVKEGQLVNITCDALPDDAFKGLITNVSVEGTAQNGVTTYSAEVEIAEPGNLRPSMNIDAEIIVESANNVLMLPTEDIKTIAGKSFVFVKDDGTGDKEKKMSDSMAKKESTDKKQKAKNDISGDMPKDGIKRQELIPEAPEGYRTVEVKIGISNEDYTEIISGLSEGQEVYKQSAQSSGRQNMMMGMPQGGMNGMGAMHGGGMPGGFSGNMGSNRGGMR